METASSYGNSIKRCDGMAGSDRITLLLFPFHDKPLKKRLLIPLLYLPESEQTPAELHPSKQSVHASQSSRSY